MVKIQLINRLGAWNDLLLSQLFENIFEILPFICLGYRHMCRAAINAPSK